MKNSESFGAHHRVNIMKSWQVIILLYGMVILHQGVNGDEVEAASTTVEPRKLLIFFNPIV